ncbi:META domain-containing protein [Croceicoccus sp. F390]|uniref:META domain-containing protein n=1 Tax=Croceicoccus esteveae TaxID=3075597 RepID=A0ABU2ZFA2_9SPHN|nr:META domain-containing protein [Croceicoccus sp. F390]MDT0575270.1 META domain-containing protein [Croceicoccus sp. F390]
MNKVALSISAAILALGTAGCATMGAGQNEPTANVGNPISVSGDLVYRERIALPPGAQMEIIVSDITNGADRELVLARSQTSIERRGPPVPFSIDVSTLNISEGPLYGLRAFIKDPDGKTMFRTSSPFLLNLRDARNEVGSIMLTMTSAQDAGSEGIIDVQDGVWRITQIGYDVAPQPTAPTINFALDGRLYGDTGCNNFSAEYKLDGSAISKTAIAVTQRACEPGLMQQERRFLDVLNGIDRVTLDADGRLVLEGNGKQMVAERSR